MVSPSIHPALCFRQHGLTTTHVTQQHSRELAAPTTMAQVPHQPPREKKPRQAPAHWTREQVLLLCRAKLEEAKKYGNSSSIGQMISAAEKWQEVTNSLNLKLQAKELPLKTQEQVKYKWENLNRDCKSVLDLESMTGIRDYSYFDMNIDDSKAVKKDLLPTVS